MYKPGITASLPVGTWVCEALRKASDTESDRSLSWRQGAGFGAVGQLSCINNSNDCGLKLQLAWV